jgi:hypothetical protein
MNGGGFLLFVAATASPLGTTIGSKATGCRLCGLLWDCDSEENHKINSLWHVARVHPWEYLEATGAMPSDEHMKLQEYLVREGFQ